jgi:hypothetical protein
LRHDHVKSVRDGAIRWGAGKWLLVSTTLVEEYIWLDRFAADKWRVYYRNALLGYLDEGELRIEDSAGRFRRTDKKCRGCGEYSVNEVLVSSVLS